MEDQGGFNRLFRRLCRTTRDLCFKNDKKDFQRTRILSSHLLMLFIFKLVLSKNRKGYSSMLSEFWELSRRHRLELPQEAPVSASSLCEARQKLSEDLFVDINHHFISTMTSSRENRWHGCRLFAVDGTKVNLPPDLVRDGYALPQEGSYYPQGLVSCLYEITSRVPHHFVLSPDLNERQVALQHLASLTPKDLVIYDRGYWSYGLIYHHEKAGIPLVMRLCETSGFKEVDRFAASGKSEEMVEILPSKGTQKKIRKQWGIFDFKPIRLKLLRYEINDQPYILATTLFDASISIKEFSDLYHGRWAIEELYKISKCIIEVEDFHAKSERGVKQEIYAHFCLITLTQSLCQEANKAAAIKKKKGFDKSRSKTLSTSFISTSSDSFSLRHRAR